MCAYHLIFISTHIIFFSKKTSVKDMADFPVPTQDVTTGDDKQGMKRISFILIRTPFYVSSSISLGRASRSDDDSAQNVHSFG